MSLIYIAVQRGVYRHDIVAACRTLVIAQEIGKASIAAEPDHYHEIQIVSRQVGKPGEEVFIGTLVPKCGPVQFRKAGAAGPSKWSELLSVEWVPAES